MATKPDAASAYHAEHRTRRQREAARKTVASGVCGLCGNATTFPETKEPGIVQCEHCPAKYVLFAEHQNGNPKP